MTHRFLQSQALQAAFELVATNLQKAVRHQASRAAALAKSRA
jgi:hypothetical protein